MTVNDRIKKQKKKQRDVTALFSLLTNIFLERLNPLQDRRVGEVPNGEQPVIDGEDEVVVVQLQ